MNVCVFLSWSKSNAVDQNEFTEVRLWRIHFPIVTRVSIAEMPSSFISLLSSGPFQTACFPPSLDSVRLSVLERWGMVHGSVTTESLNWPTIISQMSEILPNRPTAFWGGLKICTSSPLHTVWILNDYPVKQIGPDLKLWSFDAQIMSQKNELKCRNVYSP